MKFRLNEAATGLAKPPGQTALKELIVDAINKDLSIMLDSSDYCVHHINGDHSDYSSDNIAITTHNNHDTITGLTRWCNWEKLKSALSNCYVIKLHAQKLAPKDIDKIVNKLKRERKLYIDSNNISWAVVSDNVYKYCATPLDIKSSRTLHEIPFETEQDFRDYVKTNKWKKVT